MKTLITLLSLLVISTAYAGLTPFGGTGSVTSIDVAVPSALLSVSGGPITTSGSITLALSTRAANLVFAGPTTGSAAAPAFRALVAADIPSLSNGALIATTVVQPTCVVGIRGKIWVVQGGAGVPDHIDVCLKKTDDSYAWLTLGTAP